MAAPSATSALPPSTLHVRLAPGVLVRDGGRLLAGGTPFHLLRLTASGAVVAGGWFGDGAAVGASPRAAALARRLLDAGILEARPTPSPARRDISIVVPAYDRPGELDRCLAAIVATAPGVEITVIDDGSPNHDAIAAVAEAHGSALVAHPVNRGPAAARNTGLAHTTGELVVFVDSDVVVGPESGWLERLVAHFDDPLVGAAAPRVLALEPARGALAGYESRHASIDMGARSGLVAPGHPTSYVPSATLAVRRAAVPGAGFDAGLQMGEDVDFVWRMTADRWLVRYDPAATVRHAHRLAPGPFLARRRAYAMSIGPLARRHPTALPALRADPATAAAIVLIAARRPRVAFGLLLVRTLRLHRQLRGHAEHPARLSARLMLQGTTGTVRGLGHALRRAWSPLVLAAAVVRPRALTLLAAAEAVRLLEADAPRRPMDVVLGAADDLVAAAGTWEGCLRYRTARPLLPAGPRPRRSSIGPEEPDVHRLRPRARQARQPR